jgi:hypothetical protein
VRLGYLKKKLAFPSNKSTTLLYLEVMPLSACKDYEQKNDCMLSIQHVESDPGMVCALRYDDVENKNVDKKVFEVETKEYIALVEELSQGDLSKTIDFMSLCSSVLFLSDISIEVKADQLFAWIALDLESSAFNFDDFFVAMKSFERGLSHATGHAPCTEAFVRTVATQWMALADPQHKGWTDASTRVSSNHFFEFCTNRQHVVRRLLEALAAAPLQQSQGGETKEVTDTIDKALTKGPAGGDEWMANPAWKKTAERMVPPQFKSAANNAKPASTLELEWVHGYRGFDCRNLQQPELRQQVWLADCNLRGRAGPLHHLRGKARGHLAVGEGRAEADRGQAGHLPQQGDPERGVPGGRYGGAGHCRG